MKFLECSLLHSPFTTSDFSKTFARAPCVLRPSAFRHLNSQKNAIEAARYADKTLP